MDKLIIGMSRGFYHWIVFTKNGFVYGFGRNNCGQIDSNNKDKQLILVLINGFIKEKVIAISRGSSHSLALTESGHALSWDL
jgi:alpha-tubulin suppressor-like RCC1 family protein